MIGEGTSLLQTVDDVNEPPGVFYLLDRKFLLRGGLFTRAFSLHREVKTLVTAVAVEAGSAEA
jgi:hypothetical protein